MKPQGTAEEGEGRPNVLRRLYDWVLAWAERPSGPAALFGLAAAESIFFPIPPDVLLVPLAIGRPSRALWFGALCTAGSVVGAMIGYWVGLTLYDTIGQPIIELYGYSEAYGRMGELYRRNLVLTLGSAGFTPIPYKVFTIAAGGFRVAFLPFVVISAVSRGMRFFLVAGLIRIFGESIREFIDRYFNMLTIVFTLLLIGGFLVLRFFA